jgi:hypothetical protein
MEKQTIKVDVRAAPNDPDSRLISFPYPERVAASEWLGFEIPIDGGQVTYIVGRSQSGKYHYPDFQGGSWATLDWDADLEQTLAAAEKSLIEFLAGRDYEVRF